jgi:DNA-binding IclR family transcriptional regulator
LERKPLSGKEVQAATSLPLPTVYRYLGELQKIRFIIKDKGTYALTDRGRQLLEVLEKE